MNISELSIRRPVLATVIFILKATNLYYFHVYINSLFLFYQELDYLCNPNLMY